MTKVRRLRAVIALLGLSALFSSARLWGEPSDRKDRAKVLPDSNRLTKSGDPEAALAASRIAKGGVLTYRPQDGDPFFALQLKPTLDTVPPRPRDWLILVSTSAGQAGPSWAAARQITQAVSESAGADDRINIWTLSTPEERFTKSLTGKFLAPKQDAKRLQEALWGVYQGDPMSGFDSQFLGQRRTGIACHADDSWEGDRTAFNIATGRRKPRYFNGAIKHNGHYRTLRKTLEVEGGKPVGLANVR